MALLGEGNSWWATEETNAGYRYHSYPSGSCAYCVNSCSPFQSLSGRISKVCLDAYLGTTNWVVAFTDVLWVVHAMIAPFRQLFGFNFNLKLKFEEYGAVEDSEESGYFSVGLNIEVYMAPLNVNFLWWLVTWLVKPSSFNHITQAGSGIRSVTLVTCRHSWTLKIQDRFQGSLLHLGETSWDSITIAFIYQGLWKISVTQVMSKIALGSGSLSSLENFKLDVCLPAITMNWTDCVHCYAIFRSRWKSIFDISW